MSDFPGLLAAEMGVSRRTVQRRCAARQVPGAYRTKGGHWRLRKPRRIQRCWGRYDDRIVDFVQRYTSDGGYGLSARQAAQLSKIMQWLDENKLVHLAASILRRLVCLRAVNTPTIDWQFAEEMEKLIDNKEFNNAFEFSLVVNEISEDDKLPKGWEDIPEQERLRVGPQHFRELEERNPEKFDYMKRSPILEMIHPRAYEAVKTSERILKVKAEKLRLNMREATPENLARELGISVTTLYRRYGREHVKRACQGWSDYALPSDAPPIPQTTREARRDEQIRQRAARFEIRS
jgi:AraC-like DNA-binding protein